MHFVKAVVLFAGIAAAAPASSSTPAKAVAASPSPSASKAAAAAASPSKAASAISSKAAGVSSVKAAGVSSVKAAAVGSAKASSIPAKASSSPAKASSATPAKSSAPVAAQAPSASQVALLVTDLNNFDSAMQKGVTALNAFTGGSKITDQATAVSAAGDAWEKATLTLLNDAQKLNGLGQFSAADSTKMTNAITGSLGTDAVNLYNLVAQKKALFAQVNATQSVHDGLVGIAGQINQIGSAIGPHIQSSNLTAINAVGEKIYNAAAAAIKTYSS